MAEIKFKVAEPRRKKFRWLRFFAALTILLVILIVVAFFLVTNPAFIHDVVLPRVGRAVNANITASDISFSPFKQIIFRDLKVQAVGQAPVFAAAEMNVRYRLWDILHGNIHVDEVALDSLTVEIVENPDGSRNVDPLLKALCGKPGEVSKPKPASAKTPQLDVGQVTLRNVRLVEIKNFGDGQSNVMELTNLDFSLSNLKNGQSAAAQLSAALWVNNNPPNGTNGFLAATLNGKFSVALTPDLKPASASGNAQFTVSAAHGVFEDFSALKAGLDCDAMPTNIRQLVFHFQKGDTPLGELSVSGPLDLATMEGSLQVALRGIDRRLLNIAGTARGIDFGSTTISSTNEIALSNAGKTIAVTGRFVADKFQVTREDQTTPALDFNADYAVTVDNAARTAQLNKLALTGTQDGRLLLAAHLSQPMSLAWGNNAGGVGGSALDLAVTNLNLSDWQPFLGNAVSAGNVNLQMKLSSQQGGQQLGFDLNSQIADLAARMGSNQTFQATVNLSAQGEATDFKQFSLSAYRLQILQQNQPLLTALGSGAYDLADASADAQVALDASLPRLSQAFPQPDTKISSGTLKLNGRVTQQQNTQTVTGQLALADLTGQVGKNFFQAYGSTMDVDVSRTPQRIQIQKLAGTLTQNGSARGNIALTGAVDSASQKVDLSAKLSGFNQDGLRPFLEPLLAGKQLVSIAINGNASVQYAPNTSSTVKADLQVTKLVVRDPKGQFPATPLAARLQVDTALQNQSADINQIQISLTPTDRATNQIQLQGQVNFSQPKAIQGSLAVSSEALDLTPYYDLFAGKARTSGNTAPATPSAGPASATANQEPPPVNLPLRNFTLTADIGQLYLHETAITSFQTTVKADGGHVLVKPFQLMLNDAPVNGSADLDLSVLGYKYNLSLNAAQVPLTPLVDTFMPDRQGQLGGTLTANAQVAGAGTTGADLQQNLAGQFNVGVTNLNLSVVNVRSQLLKTLVNVVATIPQLLSNPETAIFSLLNRVTGQGSGGLMNQLQQSPIETITAQGRAGNGQINLQSAFVQSAAFEADASGTITLAPVLTNSTINIPITISLSRSIAGQLNLAAASTSTGDYVTLPHFLKLTRTLGNPKADINKMALAGITVQSLGNSLTQPANGNSSPVGNLLNQLLRR
jgi:hypothetical protein